MELNSEKYWDDRFSSDWEQSNGREQSAYFASLMMKALPEDILGEIAFGKYRIVDFGCAMGDCVGAFKKRFPECEVAGIDFSEVAVERARVLFPDCSFVHGDIHVQALPCDVAVCSNVLEHLNDPQSVLDRLFANASRYVIVMVPYEELYLVSEHMSRFTPRSFALEKCGFSLECVRRVVSDDARLWAGSQLLVVYKKYRVGEPQTKLSRQAVQIHEEWTDPMDMAVQHAIRNGALISDVRSAVGSSYYGLEARCAGLERQLLDMKERLEVLSASQEKRLDALAASLNLMAKEQCQYANTTLWELRQFANEWNRGPLKNFILSLPVVGGFLRRSKRVVGRIRAEGFSKAWSFYTMKYFGGKRAPTVMTLIKTERKKKKYRGVYVLPTIPWDLPIFQRPQQMAIAMAKKGYLVIYLEHVHNHPAGTMREIREGLFVVTVGDYGAAIRDLSDCIITVYSTTMCFAEQDIITRELATRNTLIYEYIDHFDEKISGPETAGLVAVFNKVISASFPIKYLASARVLKEELERRTGKKVAYVANGVDVLHFSDENIQKVLNRVELPDCLKSARPKIGYFGSLAPWLDYEMVGAVVREHPEWEFVFIGPDYYGGSKRLPVEQSNCHWIGPVPYNDLPAYAASFDVAILPFLPGDLAKSTSPLKLFEYFALCKPVVVTPDMEECRAYEEVLVGDGAEGFARAIAEAIEKAKDPEFAESLKKLAQENSWEARAQTFIEAVTERSDK